LTCPLFSLLTLPCAGDADVPFDACWTRELLRSERHVPPELRLRTFLEAVLPDGRRTIFLKRNNLVVVFDGENLLCFMSFAGGET
jgi:hypothetical protein